MMTLDDIKNPSPEDISEALLIWSKEMGELKKSITIPDPDNNFDAQPLIRASEMIDDLEILLSTIEKYNDKNSS